MGRKVRRVPYSLDPKEVDELPEGEIRAIIRGVAATGDRKYIPLLEAWAEVDYKKVRARIGYVIRQLKKIGRSNGG